MTPPHQERPPQPDTGTDFSLERRIPQPPLPARQSTRLLWWCRVILWLSPGPAWAMIGVGITWFGYSNFMIATGVATLCAFGIGYSDAFLSPRIRKREGVPVVSEALWHALAFSMMQLFIAPFVLIVLGIFLYTIHSIV